MKIAKKLEEWIEKKYRIPARIAFDRRKWRYWKSDVECLVSEDLEKILLIIFLRPQSDKTNTEKFEEFRRILMKILDTYAPLIKKLMTLKEETIFTRLAYFTDKGIDLPFWSSDKRLEDITPSFVEQMEFFNKKTREILSTFLLKKKIKGAERIHLRDGCMICEREIPGECLAIPFSFLRHIKDAKNFEEFERKIREEVALKVERLVEYLKGNEI